MIPALDTIFVNEFFNPFELFRREDKSTTKAVFLRDTAVNSSVLVYADDFSITIDNSTTRQTRHRSCLVSDASSSLVIIRINGFNCTVSFIELASYDRLLEFFRTRVSWIANRADRIPCFVSLMLSEWHKSCCFIWACNLYRDRRYNCCQVILISLAKLFFIPEVDIFLLKECGIS